MLVAYKIGDVIEINIEGIMVSCIVISDIHTRYELIKNDKFMLPITCLDPFGEPEDGYKIILKEQSELSFLCNCYYVLVGDEKVYVEHHEITKKI